MICGANNEESLRSGLQKCLTSLHFIAAAEELSFFCYQNCLDWLSWESVTEFKNFFLQNTTKKTATQITPTATQFHFRVAETAMQNFDSKFIPAVVKSCCSGTLKTLQVHALPVYGFSFLYINNSTCTRSTCCLKFRKTPVPQISGKHRLSRVNGRQTSDYGKGTVNELRETS